MVLLGATFQLGLIPSASGCTPSRPKRWTNREDGTLAANRPHTGRNGNRPNKLARMIDQAVKQLAQGPNFAALTTLLPDGQPQTNIMWVDCDDTHLLINTEVHRQKFKDVEREPRVTLAIWDRDSPYHYAEVRGRVTSVTRGAEARAHIDRLAHKYTGQDYDPSAIGSERVILHIAPHRQRSQG